MTHKTKNLSYPLNEFVRYKNHNIEIPPELEVYCYSDRKYNDININGYFEELKMIISTINNGNNTNDVIFINDVKYLINTINKKNYNDALYKLKNLNYSTKENIHFLAHELIVGVIRCPIAIKGIYQVKQDSKSLAELICNVIKYFCFHLSKEKNNNLGFHDELLKLCRKFFMDFINLTKSMDQSNENTIDNYKGFMTLIGLMHDNNLISYKIILDCIDSIKRTIFCSKLKKKQETISTDVINHHQKMFGYQKTFDDELYNYIIYFDTENNMTDDDEPKNICYRNQIECSNFYKGYENMINHIITSTELKIMDIEKKMNQNKLNYQDNIQIYDDIIKNNNSKILSSYMETHHFHEINKNVIEYVKNESNNIQLISENLKNQIGKYDRFIKSIILSHNDFSLLNEKYKTLNKEILVSPLKHHILINHKEKLEYLEKLQIKCSNIINII
jgi:hypothetical protein